jgi:hypothetical protein
MAEKTLGDPGDDVHAIRPREINEPILLCPLCLLWTTEPGQ